MNKYLILIFLIYILSSAYHAYSQEEAILSSDIVFVLDYPGILSTNVSASLTEEILLKILGDLPGDSRISFVVFAEQSELALPLTPLNEEGTNKKITQILDRFIHSGTMATVAVKSGDTLWDIAGKYYGDPFQWPILVSMNRIANSGKSLAGETAIRIPSAGVLGLFKDYSQRTHVGHINMPEAIERSIYELKNSGREGAKSLIILVTDGIIDVGDGVWSIEKYRWLKDELTAESKKLGVQIFSVILSEQADFEMMQTLAKQTDGGYYRVFKDEDVQLAVSGIMGNMENTTAVQKQENIAATEQGQSAIVEQEPIELVEVVEPTESEESSSLTLVLIIAVGALAIGTIAFVVKRNKARASKDTGIPEAYLMDLSGVTDKNKYMIDKRAIKVGRAGDTDVDLCISEDTISAEHARIEYRDNAFYLIDMGSKNGTYLNKVKERITGAVYLKNGDIISFGEYDFKFVVSDQMEEGQAQISPASDTPKVNSIPEEELINIEAYLVDASRATDEKTHRINRRVIKIGRINRDDIDICIAKNTVSAEHAQIEYKDNGFYLLDLGSRNGTYLNEAKERITSEVQLKNDDIIYFDQYRFRFVLNNQDIKSKAS